MQAWEMVTALNPFPFGLWEASRPVPVPEGPAGCPARPEKRPKVPRPHAGAAIVPVPAGIGQPESG